MISADAFLQLCKLTAVEVKDAVSPLVGTDFGGEEIAIGADNTPTERLDKVAEDIVLKNFRGVKACKSLLSEEAGLVDIGGDKGIIYLDPIDGSYNAASGLPFYAISLGLSDGETMVAGFVQDLCSGEIFTAVHGKGAFVNEKPIHPSPKTDICKASIAYYANKNNRRSLHQNGVYVRRTRQFGASALELCYVAAGRLEAFLDLRGNLRITDAAAGMLICSEAGVCVTQPDGTAVSFPNNVRTGCKLLAAAPVLHNRIVESLEEEEE